MCGSMEGLLFFGHGFIPGSKMTKSLFDPLIVGKDDTQLAAGARGIKRTSISS